MKKIKTSRFIIPRIRSYSTSLDWDAMQMIRDIDRVFAMLDGKAEPEVSLESVLDRNLQELKREARLSGSYFDVRFYPGVGTIHFFPSKEKNLVDRLNRLVGKHRQWISFLIFLSFIRSSLASNPGPCVRSVNLPRCRWPCCCRSAHAPQ